MRFVLLLIVAFTATVVACSPGAGGDSTSVPEPLKISESLPDRVTSESRIPGGFGIATPNPLAYSLWSGESVIDEIAGQPFEVASRPVHIFGLNVEAGEEFVPPGRDVLPLPPDTPGWRAEFEGEGVWIVDTGELIYRFFEADTRFDVLARVYERAIMALSVIPLSEI